MAQPPNAVKKPAQAGQTPTTLGTGGGLCTAQGCKGSASQFNFCSEHYEHFKFGLIKKTGQPVSDWDKKIEHFKAYQAKQSARKAA